LTLHEFGTTWLLLTWIQLDVGLGRLGLTRARVDLAEHGLGPIDPN